MAYNEKVKVRKDGVTKEIQKKDLPDYIKLGWQEVKDYFEVNKFQRII